MDGARTIVGVDEVGRGPLAGPVSVGVVVVPRAFDMANAFPGLRDSKKMTPAAREGAYTAAQALQKKGILMFGVFSTPAHTIDAIGIEKSISRCIALGLRSLALSPEGVKIFLDGRLRAPDAYDQKSIIRGDDVIPAISLASVIAKVRRDRYMSEVMEHRYPGYGFSRHKGYGTAEHFAALARLGVSAIHRQSFLKINADGIVVP